MKPYKVLTCIEAPRYNGGPPPVWWVEGGGGAEVSSLPAIGMTEIEDRLNALASEGWRIVGVTGHQIILGQSGRER